MNSLLNKQHSYSVFSLAVAISLLASLIISSLFDMQSTLFYWVANALYSFVIGSVGFLYLKVQKMDVIANVKIKTKLRWFDFLFVAVAVFVAINFTTPINSWFCQLLEDAFPNYTAGVSIPQDSNWFQLILVVCIFASINEEFLFRGIIANGFLSKGPVYGILLSSALFALFHMNPAQTLPQFVLGCVFALGFYKSQSVIVPIFAHFFSNLSVLLLSEFVEPTGFYQDNVLLAVAGSLIFVAVFFVYAKFTPKVESEKVENTKVLAPTWVAFIFAIGWCLFNWIGNMVLA